MPTHEEIKASTKAQMRECHARIDQDVEKLKSHPDYETLPRMVKCYVDIVLLDINLLKERELNAFDHIDVLDNLLDQYQAAL